MNYSIITSSVTAILFIITSLLISSSSQESNVMRETKTILNNLLATYDPKMRPSTSNVSDDPVKITFDVLVWHFYEFSDIDMEYKMQLYFVQEWFDERLTYEDKGQIRYITLLDVSQIWTADVHFLEVRHGKLHGITKPNAFVRIYPSGRIVYSACITVTASCDLLLERFPFDVSTCCFRMANYAYSMKDVIFKWKEDHPFSIARHAKTNALPMDRMYTFDCTGTIEYNCLGFVMEYHRDTQYYLLHTFLPSALLVAASWGGFLMDRQAVTARSLVVISPLLVLTHIAAKVNVNVPKIGYIKAIDVWIGGCFVFLLAELVLFAVVGSPETDIESPAHNSCAGTDDATVSIDMSMANYLRVRPSQVEPRDCHQDSVYRKILQKLPSDPVYINRLSCWILPILYLVFSAVYFLKYCYFDNHFEL